MTQPYRLYGELWSRAVGPMMVLEELDLAYEVVPVDAWGGGLEKPSFLDINPAGFLPALTTPDGEHLHENAAIMLYLAERHGGPDLVPGPQEADRGRFLSRFFFLTNDIQPPSKRFFFSHRYALRREDVPAVHDQARKAAEERWSVLDGMLAGDGPWHLGQRFSIADLQMAVWAAYGFEDVDDIIAAFPAVRRVFEGVLARPKSGHLLLRQRKALADLKAGR